MSDPQSTKKFWKQVWKEFTGRADSERLVRHILLPRRGDFTEQWLESHRNQFLETDSEWHILDALLVDYRLHADTCTHLDKEVTRDKERDDAE